MNAEISDVTRKIPDDAIDDGATLISRFGRAILHILRCINGSEKSVIAPVYRGFGWLEKYYARLYASI